MRLETSWMRAGGGDKIGQSSSNPQSSNVMWRLKRMAAREMPSQVL
jgi:hypothetical protein